MNCLICHQTCQLNILSFLESESSVCIKCLNKFEVINTQEFKKIIINKQEFTYELNILFTYNNFTKDYMYYLKEKQDVALVKVMKYYLQEIVNDNLDYTWIPVKSAELTYQKRGFYPNEELINQLNNIKINEGPIRIDDIKQGKLSKKDRVNTKQCYKKVVIKEKNIIILDDVIVTGSTITQYIQNIEFKNLQNLKVVILLKGKKY